MRCSEPALLIAQLLIWRRWRRLVVRRRSDGICAHRERGERINASESRLKLGCVCVAVAWTVATQGLWLAPSHLALRLRHCRCVREAVQALQLACDACASALPSVPRPSMLRRSTIRLAARARRSLTNAAPTAASSSSTTTSSSAAASSASADATAELLTFAPSLLQFGVFDRLRAKLCALGDAVRRSVDAANPRPLWRRRPHVAHRLRPHHAAARRCRHLLVADRPDLDRLQARRRAAGRRRQIQATAGDARAARDATSSFSRRRPQIARVHPAGAARSGVAAGRQLGRLVRLALLWPRTHGVGPRHCLCQAVALYGGGCRLTDDSD